MITGLHCTCVTFVICSQKTVRMKNILCLSKSQSKSWHLFAAYTQHSNDKMIIKIVQKGVVLNHTEDLLLKDGIRWESLLTSLSSELRLLKDVLLGSIRFTPSTFSSKGSNF